MAKLEELQQQIQQLLAGKEETNNIIQELAADKAATKQQIQVLQIELEARNQAMAEAMGQAMATALHEAGGGGAPADRHSKRSNVKMPIFKKDGSEDFLLFFSRFKAWASLTSLTEEDKIVSFFISLEGEATAIARIFGPGTATFEKNYEEYTECIKNLF